MGKERGKTVVWTIYLQGSMTALWVYFCGLFLAALFLVKGILPESAMFPVIAGLCAVASLLSGLFVSGKATAGTLPASILNALIFAGILVLAGMACWREIVWQGHGGILVLCALAGGLLAGMLAKPKGRKSRRGKSRLTRK